MISLRPRFGSSGSAPSTPCIIARLFDKLGRVKLIKRGHLIFRHQLIFDQKIPYVTQSLRVDSAVLGESQFCVNLALKKAIGVFLPSHAGNVAMRACPPMRRLSLLYMWAPSSFTSMAVIIEVSPSGLAGSPLLSINPQKPSIPIPPHPKGYIALDPLSI